MLYRTKVVVCSEINKNYLLQFGQNVESLTVNFHSCAVHLDTIESFIYPTDAHLDCSKNVKICMRGAATCFGFSQQSSVSLYMCFALYYLRNPTCFNNLKT